VCRRRDEPTADPKLEQSRVDVDERAAPRRRDDLLTQLIVEVEEEVDIVQDVGELEFAHERGRLAPPIAGNDHPVIGVRAAGARAGSSSATIAPQSRAPAGTVSP
jgi:hypothetical protein